MKVKKKDLSFYRGYPVVLMLRLDGEFKFFGQLYMYLGVIYNCRSISIVVIMSPLHFARVRRRSQV